MPSPTGPFPCSETTHHFERTGIVADVKRRDLGRRPWHGSWADLEQLSPWRPRGAVDDVLIGWLDTGPPRDRPRNLAGVTLFEHHLPHPALAIAYFVDDHQQLVGVLRISHI